MTPCFSSLLILSFFTFSKSSTSSSASSIAALASNKPLPLNERTKLVTKPMDMPLLVTLGFTTLQSVDSLFTLHLMIELLWTYVGVARWKRFAVERKFVAIFLYFLFIFLAHENLEDTAIWNIWRIRLLLDSVI